MTIQKLKPCPDCGNTKLSLITYDHGGRRVECEDCTYMGQDGVSLVWAARLHNQYCQHRERVLAAAKLAIQPYLICDLRTEWSGKPYITFWRPKNANYAYPLIWAGDYTKEEVDAKAHYYNEQQGKNLIRFAVPREVAEAIVVAPEPGRIDGDVGPVVRNIAINRRKLRKAAYLPAVILEGLQHGR